MEDLLIVLVYMGYLLFPILILIIVFLLFLMTQFISYRIFHFNLYKYLCK